MSLPPSQAILNSDETSYGLDNLDPDTKYDVKLTAIYPDEAESEDLMGSARTCELAAEEMAFLYPRKKVPRDFK